MASLMERILWNIRGASSQRPACAPDVLAIVGGPEADFWAALEQLVGERLINTALIQRGADKKTRRPADPAPWLAIWPTGVVPRPEPLTGKSFSGLFMRHAMTLPAAMRAASAPRSRPEAC